MSRSRRSMTWGVVCLVVTVSGTAPAPAPARAQAVATSRSAHVAATIVRRGTDGAVGNGPMRAKRVLVLTVAEGWHIYGTRSGTAGIPTQLQWTVVSPARVSGVVWPLPDTVIRGRDTTFEYQGQVTVPFAIISNVALKSGQHAVDISLGVCREICIPERLRVVFRAR